VDTLREQKRVAALAAARLGLGSLPDDGSGVDVVLPLLERIREEGATVLLELDGGREARAYSVLVSGGPLAADFLRADAETLDAGLAQVLSAYATRVWGA
jgi:hypothetical protein